METTFVLKIKYADTLCRIPVQASPPTNGPDLSYSQLEDIIWQIFKLPVSLELVITYTDIENDVVTMIGDRDLQDACVNQGLNPLRLQVTTVASPTAATPDNIPPPPPPPPPPPAPVPPSATPVDDQSIPSSKAPNVSGAAAAATAQEDYTVVHFGVRCDMCYVLPIVGPRHKSIRIARYDLCQACFEKHGNAEDYDKLRKPWDF